MLIYSKIDEYDEKDLQVKSFTSPGFPDIAVLVEMGNEQEIALSPHDIRELIDSLEPYAVKA